MIYKPTIQCPPKEAGFTFDFGSSQGFFMSSQGRFPCYRHVITDPKFDPYVCKPDLLQCLLLKVLHK